MIELCSAEGVEEVVCDCPLLVLPIPTSAPDVERPELPVDIALLASVGDCWAVFNELPPPVLEALPLVRTPRAPPVEETPDDDAVPLPDEEPAGRGRIGKMVGALGLSVLPLTRALFRIE